MENQNVVQNCKKPCSPQVEAARASIWAILNEKKSKSESKWGASRVSPEYGCEPHSETAYGGLLTPMQVECIKEIQHRCFKIDLEVEEINTRLVNAELSNVLPRLYMIEVTDLLYKIDRLISEVKSNAAKMGVAAVQPKVNMAYLDYRLRSEGSRTDLERAAIAAAQRTGVKV